MNNQIKDWRCFHCDEVFTSPTAAEEHFGKFIWQEPVCHITAAKYREMELLNSLYQQEDTDLHRQIHSLQSLIEVKTREANERGYAQALEAIKLHPEELGLQPIDTALLDLESHLYTVFGMLWHINSGEFAPPPELGIPIVTPELAGLIARKYILAILTDKTKCGEGIKKASELLAASKEAVQ